MGVQYRAVCWKETYFYVSEENVALIFRVEELEFKATFSSETSTDFQQPTRRCIP
jgi:hypothetical protein